MRYCAADFLMSVLNITRAQRTRRRRGELIVKNTSRLERSESLERDDINVALFKNMNAYFN